MIFGGGPFFIENPIFFFLGGRQDKGFSALIDFHDMPTGVFKNRLRWFKINAGGFFIKSGFSPKNRYFEWFLVVCGRDAGGQDFE